MRKTFNDSREQRPLKMALRKTFYDSRELAKPFMIVANSGNLRKTFNSIREQRKLEKNL